MKEASYNLGVPDLWRRFESYAAVSKLEPGGKRDGKGTCSTCSCNIYQLLYAGEL